MISNANVVGLKRSVRWLQFHVGCTLVHIDERCIHKSIVTQLRCRFGESDMNMARPGRALAPAAAAGPRTLAAAAAASGSKTIRKMDAHPSL